MPLPKQKFVINLGQGVDTKTDKKLIVPGKLQSLENGVFKKVGRIDKRYGNDLIASTTVGGDELDGASSLVTFNNELLQYNKQKLYSFSSGSQKWIDKGTVVSASVTTKQAVKNTASQTQCDYASVNGVAVYAWEDSRGGVRASVYDETTHTAIIADTVIDASASRARCLAFKEFLFVFYYKSGSLFVRRISASNPGSFDSAIEVSDTVNTTSPNYDVFAYENLRIAWAHNVEGASEILFGWLNDEPAVLTGTFTAVTISEAATNCLGIVLGPSSRFFVTYHNSSDGLRGVILNNGGSEVVSPFTIDSHTSTNIINVTGFKERDETGVTLFYHVAAAAAHNHFIRYNTVDNDGTVGTPTVFLRSVGLWSKAFSYYFDSENTDHAYVGVVHSSTLQSTYFVVRNDGLIIGKMQYGLGCGHTTRPILCNVIQTSDDIFNFALLNKFKLVSENNNVFSLQGVCKTTVNFDSEEEFFSVQLGDNLHIVGGILNMYDGQSVVEHGFHLYPENMSASQSGASGVADGDYNYIALYEWTDNYGQIHRSAPSVPTPFTVTGGPRNVAIVVPTLRLTQKKATANRSEISVVLYRTEDGPGAVYYRTSSITTPTLNNTANDTVTITDTTADAALISNEILYTTGGVLDNFAPPSSKHIAVFKDRVFLMGLENENQVVYSKAHTSGEPVEFSSELTLETSSEGGSVTSGVVLDDKFVLFKADRFTITFGDGPNNAGLGGEFAKPQRVTGDVGCISPSSIVAVPQGIIFKSQKGIYLLNSALETSYVGAEVEDFNSKTITSAVQKSDVNQIRFTTADGPLLIYDYFFNQWSTFTPLNTQDAVIWDNKYVFINESGQVIYEVDGSYRDQGAGIRLKLVSGWIALDTIVGLQRVYKLSVIGEYRSYHKLRVSVGYDFSEVWADQYVFDTETGLNVDVYGEDSPYGASNTVYGGDNNSYRFACGLSRQKCQAIRIMIEDLTTSGAEGSGEAYNITGIGLLASVKGQMGKFQSSQRIASS